MEFESKINTDFKAKCIERFENALNDCAFQHEQHALLDSPYKGVIGRGQPKKVSIKIEYFWDDDITKKQDSMFCNPIIDLTK